MTIDNGPNKATNPDDSIRRKHLTNLLSELGNPDALSPFGDGTPLVDYYLACAKDPDSVVSQLPYSQETGIPEGNVDDLKYGDVKKVMIVGTDFLTLERERLAITVGFRVIALMGDPPVVDGKTNGIFAHNDDWISYLKKRLTQFYFRLSHIVVPDFAGHGPSKILIQTIKA